MKRLMLIILLLGSPAVWAADETVIIDVEAMTCPLCVTVVNKVLRQTDGVIKPSFRS
jgi:mercuric ion binding protein